MKTTAMATVSDDVIYALVRCLLIGASASGFGYRVYDEAVRRGLIRYVDGKGYVAVEGA